MIKFLKKQSTNTEPKSKRSYKMTNQHTVKTTKESREIEETNTHSRVTTSTLALITAEC